MTFQDCPASRDDFREAEPAGQEQLDRRLVGRVEHGPRRAPGASRLADPIPRPRSVSDREAQSLTRSTREKSSRAAGPGRRRG